MRVSGLRMEFLSAALAAGLFAASAFAQAPPPGPGHRHPPPPFGGFDMLGFEGIHDGKIVKGAPFSAVGVSETTQVLADGTHIHRQISTALFRDSQGRSRREVTLPAIGPLAASGDAPHFVMIHDPVAGVRFVLDVKNKTANKRNFTPRTHGGSGEGARPNFNGKGESDMVKTESLGTQVIEGVSAEGTRRTRTIPAGRIGNDKPISIVSEVWYSPDLQLVVMTRRSDPRFGETTYKLSNIHRTEPSASLFQPPADFAVQEGMPGGWRRRHDRGPQEQAPPPPSNDEL